MKHPNPMTYVTPPLITQVRSRGLGSCQLHHWCDAV